MAPKDIYMLLAIRLKLLSSKAYEMENENLGAMKAHISKMSGVPANLITGHDKQSLEESAQKIARYAESQRKEYLRSLIPAGAYDAAPGRFANDCESDEDEVKREFVAQLFGRE